jgi:hypothetical protein
VDNFVDNAHLTAADASIDAGFNKMLIRRAKIISLKIKDLF